jgi:RNA polymerase sigma-70 factor (ECF subfamily)
MAELNVNALVREYGQKVYNIAFRITGNQHDAEDVTQETFLQVHRGLDAFRGESAVYTWIYRIAVNASLQVKRKLDKAYLDSLDEAIAVFKDDIPEEVRRWKADPEDQHLYEEVLDEVRKACYHFITFRLSDEQRVVYVLRVVLGFSLDEVSTILQIDKNTVKARLQRAKGALSTYFHGRCQWVEGAGDCSCESRLGFALSFAPEILRRLQNHPPDEATKAVVRRTLKDIRDIDEIYRNLPTERYQTDELEAYLKGA